MIFLSHNYEDKPVVEPLALRLRDVFGQDNIFYDSWSIQPGEGIIDRMNRGLEKCEFFFFFVSKNSLESNMVALEWQNAVMRSAREDVKIIPIRLDGSIMPTILSQTLYLDLFTNGLETTLRQIADVIEGNNTFTAANNQFSNLLATCTKDGLNLEVTIEAKHYMEPKSHFIILLNNSQYEARVSPKQSGMSMKSFQPNLKLNNGVKGNGWYIGVSEPTVPGFPFEIVIHSIKGSQLNFLTLLHEVAQGQFQSIPIEFK